MNALKLAAPSVAKAMTPQASPYAPEKPKPDALSQAGNALLRGFQRGFDPKGYAASQEQSQMDEQERAKQTLALMQQQRQMPEPQRAVWWTQNADQIGQIVGADVRSMPVDPSKFSDQALDGQIAMLSAKLGMAPEQPEGPDYQFLQGPDGAISRADRTSGGLEMLQPGTPKPRDPVKGEQFTDANGQVWLIDPYSGEAKPVRGVRGRVPGTETGPRDRFRAATPEEAQAYGATAGQINLADGRFYPTEKPGQLTPYQEYQVERGRAEDEVKANDRIAKRENAIYSLEEGIGLVNQLVNSNGFSALYGAQGALPRLPGTPGADAEAMLEQIGGQAFLAGVETMRGTGPLSDNEGRKVAAARTRLLNRAQSPEAAKRAAEEFVASMQRLWAAYQKESGQHGDVEPPGLSSPSTGPQYTPQQVQEAQTMLQNFDALPPHLKTPQMRASLEAIAGVRQQTVAQPSAADLGDDELRAMLGLD